MRYTQSSFTVGPSDAHALRAYEMGWERTFAPRAKRRRELAAREARTLRSEQDHGKEQAADAEARDPAPLAHFG